MEDLLNGFQEQLGHFNTAKKYLFATIVHWSIGLFCGIELELAKIHRNVSQAILAAVLFTGWIVYESVEYLTEHDNPSVDIANGIIFLIIGIFVTHSKHRHIVRYLEWRVTSVITKRGEDVS